MKKTNLLNYREFNQFKLSRREFCISSVILAFSGPLNSAPSTQSTLIMNIINTMGLDASIERVGEWMRNNLPTDKSTQLVNEAAQRLSSSSALSKSNIIEMISSDYSQRRTVDILSIRFSTIEAALCITASTFTSKNWVK